MARAEKTAKPTRAQIRRRDFRPVCRRATEVSADADADEDLGLDRPMLVLAVCRLFRVFGAWIRQQGIELGKALEHLRRAIDHPDDLTAPLDVDLLPRLELADVDLDRRPRRLGALARRPAPQEWDRGRDRSDPANDAGRTDQEPALSRIDLAF